MAEGDWAALSRGQPFLGRRTWLGGSGNPSSDSTASVVIVLGHPVPIPFLPLSQKAVPNGRIWGALGCCLHPLRNLRGG